MRTLVVVVVLCGAVASAQCQTDAECPAGGTCNAGACVTPSTPAAATTPVVEPAPVDDGPSVGDQALGWSPAGAVFGFTGTGVVVSTGIIAMTFAAFGPNVSTTPAAMIFMVASAASTAGLGLLAHFGAQSALKDPANAGAPGFAIAGFTFYALSLAASGVSMVTWFISNASFITFFAQLGALVSGAFALLFFGLEAVECGTNALRLRKQQPKRADAPVRVMPTFSFAPRADGRTLDPVLGLAGTF